MTSSKVRVTRRRILLLAGEASGDLHGSHVAGEIRKRWPHAELVGLGGPRMADASVDLLHGLDDLAVMGFVEVLGRLRFFRRLEKRLTTLLASGQIDMVVPIDYPGLNLRITKQAARLGVPTVFYISPQVWAWKGHRAEALARDADRIAVILPFEVPIYDAVGGNVSFVGHPLLDELETPPSQEARRNARQRLCRQLGLNPSAPILALFPGSRVQELDRHGGPFRRIAEAVRKERSEVQVVVAKTPSLAPVHYAPMGFHSTEEGTALLLAADAGLIKSGTSTLEAALMGLPFAVAYRTHPVTYQLARRLVKVPSVALANLVAGATVVPEFLQSEVVPERVTPVLLELLDQESQVRTDVVSGLEAVRDKLGTPGAAGRVVDLMEDVFREREMGALEALP